MDGDGRAADGSSDGPRSERRRAVDAAVVVLRHAVGGAGAGARYLEHVDQWVARLDSSASKLVPFSSAMKTAGFRLPAVAREAHGVFVQTVDAARELLATAAGVEVAAGGADAPPLRQQRVRAAVDELARVADGAEGTAYLQKVEAWARRLQPSAQSLGTLSNATTKAGQRWASTTPAALEARDTFVTTLKKIRADTRTGRINHRTTRLKAGSVLGGGVRGARCCGCVCGAS